MHRLGRVAAVFVGALEALDAIALAAILVAFIVGVVLYVWRMV
jgi:hypothetical protein